MENLEDDMVFPVYPEKKEWRKIAAEKGRIKEFEKRLAMKGDERSDIQDVFILIYISVSPPHFPLFFMSLQWGLWKSSLNWREVFKCLNFI